MSRIGSISRGALGVLLAVLASWALAQGTAKTKVSSETDLPRFLYQIPGTASDFVDGDEAAFDAFTVRVRGDLDHVLSDYDIADKATQRELLGARLDAQEIVGDYKGGLETIEQLRGLQEKPSAKLLFGLQAKARLEAALETGATSGDAYVAAFKRHYKEAIDPLPWDVVQDSVKEAYRGARIGSKAAALGQVKTMVDPPLAKSGSLDNLQAWQLLGARNYLTRSLPLQSARVEVLKSYIDAHNVVKPDIWAAREVTLTADQKLTPVLVAIWDSGIDVSLFPGQVFNDPKPTASGNHGLAWDDEGHPSKSWTHPLTAAQTQAYPAFRDDIKGGVDLQNGVDSPEAQALQKKMATFTPEQMRQRGEFALALGHYVHGTHCAGIAVRGNPAARLVVARFNDDLPYLNFAPTTVWAKRMKANFHTLSLYFNSRHVRVVNMSWGDEVAEFEQWLSRTVPSLTAEERKKRASELFSIWREAVEGAIKNSPGTLFITAAGNSDSDASFIEDVPSSLHEPNLITVGAVNQAGDETSFTSSGETVLVHANGYHVESFVPGGARLPLSGTSMASPNVVNLAAKLFALDPSLTPQRVIELIRAGATASDDGRRHLIDEKASVALLKNGTH